MNYYICEGKTDEIYNAGVKARSDVEKILEEQGYEKIFVETTKVKGGKSISNIISHLKILYAWDKSLKKLNKNDIILLQYPIIKTAIGMEKIIKKHSKRLTIIALIHDLNSVRFIDESKSKILPTRDQIQDKKILNTCSYIIAHNEAMKDKLIKLGNDEKNIKTLKLFDYLLDRDVKERKCIKEQPVIIAGNLASYKSEYLKYLKDIKDVKFNLYGKGYEGNEENVSYKGAFLPEELINNLEGSMGLVWDGSSKDTCVGDFGQYLKYNNPHKVSMYLTAGIPVVIWEEAALAKFIVENNLGYTIKRLDDLTELRKNITEEDYQNKMTRIKKVSEKLKNGGFLKDVLEKIKMENVHGKGTN